MEAFLSVLHALNTVQRTANSSLISEIHHLIVTVLTCVQFLLKEDAKFLAYTCESIKTTPFFPPGFFFFFFSFLFPLSRQKNQAHTHTRLVPTTEHSLSKLKPHADLTRPLTEGGEWEQTPPPKKQIITKRGKVIRKL